MYFPKLRNLSQYNIEPVAVNIMDTWLAIQRPAVIQNLSPARFSIQNDLDYDLAIDMFLLSTSPSIGVLKSRYIVLCPQCEQHFKSFDNLGEIENKPIECIECGYQYKPLDRLDYIELKFERILAPSKSLANSREIGDNQLGKNQSLRVSDIAQNNDNTMNARRLALMGLDGRYEAAQ